MRAPVSAPILYREVKVLLAEDARRRQEASRFGSNQGGPRDNGGATVAPPSVPNGKSRTQAALLVTGKRSYTTLERIGDLQRIAADQSLDATLRSRANVELALIHNGGSVESAHRRMTAQLAVSEPELPADDDTEAADMLQASSIGDALVHTAELTTPEIELEQLAQDALARAKAAPKAGNIRPATFTDIKLPVRSFVFLWNDLREWWLRYDCSEISSELTDEQWDQIEATLAGTIAFLERLRSLRAESHRAVHESVTSAPCS